MVTPTITRTPERHSDELMGNHHCTHRMQDEDTPKAETRKEKAPSCGRGFSYRYPPGTRKLLPMFERINEDEPTNTIVSQWDIA